MRYHIRSTALFFLLFIFLLPGFSQEKGKKEKKRSGDIGIGYGIDYGGLGIQLNQFIGPVCLFGSYGYNYVYFMPSGGIKYYIPLGEYDINYAPYIKVIYGYNAVIIIKNDPKKFYNGFTPGIGTDIRFGKKKSYGFNIDINYPIRTKEYKKDLDYFKFLYPKYKPDLWPFLFSVGFQVCLDL